VSWESTIVTDGLVGYWNSKQGVVDNTWHNIAPATKGKYDGSMSGAILQSDDWTEGVWFDGVDDYVYIPVDGLEGFESFTIEFRCTFKEYWWSSPFTVNVDELGFWWGGSAIGAWMGNGDSEISHRFHSDVTYNIAFVHDASKHPSESISWYVNGVLNTESIGMSDTSINPFIEATEIVFTEGLYGYYHFARLYNRALAPEEVAQNYLVGDNVGLPEEPENPPQITIINVNRYKISGNPPIDKSIITFKCDVDIFEWKANVMGVSHDTGTVADNGGIVSSENLITATIDWTKVQEGSNRVNIYSRGSGGWTPYAKPKPTVITDGLFGYWDYNDGFVDSMWKNKAPSTVGTYNGEVRGAKLQSNGIRFDNNDMIYMPMIERLNMPIPLTIEIAIICNNTGSADIISNENWGGFISVTQNGTIDYYINSTDWSNMGFSSTNFVKSNDVQYYAFAYSPIQGILKTYKNGELIDTVVGLPDDLTSGIDSYHLAFGSMFGANNGQIIQSIRFYDRTLKDDEVLNNYIVEINK